MTSDYKKIYISAIYIKKPIQDSFKTKFERNFFYFWTTLPSAYRNISDKLETSNSKLSGLPTPVSVTNTQTFS